MWILEFLLNPWSILILIGILVLVPISMVAEHLVDVIADSPLFGVLEHSWSVNKWESETRRALRWIMPLWLVWTVLTFIPVAFILGTLIGLGALKTSIVSFVE